MKILPNRFPVIKNIEQASSENRFNDKVEVDDPQLSEEEKNNIVDKHLKLIHTPFYKIANLRARVMIGVMTKQLSADTKIVGIENLNGLKGGAIVTSNHFNPADNAAVRWALYHAGFKRLFIVSQDTNLAMKGFFGFLMNYSDIIPLTKSREHLNRYFPTLLKERLDKGFTVLIYPEQEMWFNYRKPRPPKRGAYYYAALNNVPIISCFVAIRDLTENESIDFYKTQYIIYILKIIYPDPALTARDNSIRMMETDYRQKVAAYESAYNTKLDYNFENSDIAGWIHQDD